MIPKEVTVKIKDRVLTVKGPKGELKMSYRPELKVTVDNEQVKVSRFQESRLARSLHGLTRTLIANMIEGVTEGFQKTLKIVGTGYRVVTKDRGLVLNLGFSHPVEVKPIEGIEFGVEGKDLIMIRGVDKALVGQTAAKIRSISPPEPYKGKGIRYQDEEVKLKPGKAGKAGAAGAEGGAQ